MIQAKNVSLYRNLIKDGKCSMFYFRDKLYLFPSVSVLKIINVPSICVLKFQTLLNYNTHTSLVQLWYPLHLIKDLIINLQQMNTLPGAWITFPATSVSRYILRALTLLIKSQHMKRLNSSNKFKVLIKKCGQDWTVKKFSRIKSRSLSLSSQ